MDNEYPTNNTPVNAYSQNTYAQNAYPQNGAAGYPAPENTVSSKSKAVAALLNFFLGTLGIHRFYLGKIGTGIIMLVLTIIGASTAIFYVGWAFVAIVGIWDLIDFFIIILGKMKDGQGKLVK